VRSALGGRGGDGFLRGLNLCLLEPGAVLLHVEVEVALEEIDDHLVAGLDRAREHHPGECVLDQALDRPPERPGAKIGVEPFTREEAGGVVRELNLDPLRVEMPGETVDEEAAARA